MEAKAYGNVIKERFQNITDENGYIEKEDLKELCEDFNFNAEDKFIELNDDLKINKTNNSLDNWAKQGVFLINSVLTVEKDKPGSHKFLNWERFTDYVIKVISDKKENIVFILLGNYARSKKPLIDEKKHLIIETTHPSPFSVHRGFFGSKIFSRTNNYLKEKNKNTIDFSL